MIVRHEPNSWLAPIRWLGRGNAPTRLALVVTVMTWGTLPVLWSVNEWGVLSLVEVYWLLVVAMAWLRAAAGLTRPGALDDTLPMVVFVWSSVVPTMLLLLLFLAYALDPGPMD